MARLPKFSRWTLLLFVAVTAAVLSLVLLPLQRRTRFQRTRITLLTVGLAYHHCLENAGTPPSKLQDMDRCTCEVGAPARQAIEDGRVVVFWNGAVAVANNGTYVLGYEKDVPQRGGLVLMADGTVRSMTTSEFQAAPKVPTAAADTAPPP